MSVTATHPIEALKCAKAQLEADHYDDVAAEMFGAEPDPKKAMNINRFDVIEMIDAALSPSPVSGDVMVPRSALEEKKPFGMLDGEWSWRSFTAGENEGKTIIFIQGVVRGNSFMQSWVELDWAHYDGRPEAGRQDAEDTANLICAAVNRTMVLSKPRAAVLPPPTIETERN